MASIAIWLVAAGVYLAFRAWYDGWRRPLSAEEIEGFLKKLETTPSGELNDLETFREFLSRDDGREFVMLNLVRIGPDPVPHPETGEPTRPAQLLREYMRGFLPLLIRHAGHPAIQARKLGGYVDAWNVEPDPGWSFVGAMRYRSRRDMMELATNPRFLAAHPFKVAAIPVTFSFPTSPVLGLYVGPRIWVGLVLALAAALTQLAVHAFA